MIDIAVVKSCSSRSGGPGAQVLDEIIEATNVFAVQKYLGHRLTLGTLDHLDL